MQDAVAKEKVAATMGPTVSGPRSNTSACSREFGVQIPRLVQLFRRRPSLGLSGQQCKETTGRSSRALARLQSCTGHHVAACGAHLSSSHVRAAPSEILEETRCLAKGVFDRIA